MADFDPFERSLAARPSVRRRPERRRDSSPEPSPRAAMAGTQRRPAHPLAGSASGGRSSRWPVAAAAVIARARGRRRVLRAPAASSPRSSRVRPRRRARSPAPACRASYRLRVRRPARANWPRHQQRRPRPSSRTPAGAWIATGSMGTPRYGHTAVRLLDGRVLVVGGADELSQNDLTAELYDPNSGTWSATGSMVKPHAWLPATLLRDGRVLVGDVDEPDGRRPGSSAQRCTTRPAGPGPPPGRWSTVDRRASIRHVAARRQGARARFVTAPELYDPDTGPGRRPGR